MNKIYMTKRKHNGEVAVCSELTRARGKMKSLAVAMVATAALAVPVAEAAEVAKVDTQNQVVSGTTPAPVKIETPGDKVAIGNATVGSTAGSGGQVAIGAGTFADGQNSTAVGAGTQAMKTQGVAIGTKVTASKAQATAIGNETSAGGYSSIAIGSDDLGTKEKDNNAKGASAQYATFVYDAALEEVVSNPFIGSDGKQVLSIDPNNDGVESYLKKTVKIVDKIARTGHAGRPYTNVPALRDDQKALLDFFGLNDNRKFEKPTNTQYNTLKNQAAAGQIILIDANSSIADLKKVIYAKIDASSYIGRLLDKFTFDAKIANPNLSDSEATTEALKYMERYAKEMGYAPANDTFDLNTLDGRNKLFNAINARYYKEFQNTRTTAVGAIAIGGKAQAMAKGSVSIGVASMSRGDESLALGVGTITTGDRAVGVGTLAIASGDRSVAIGTYSKAPDTLKGEMRYDAPRALGDDAVAIGAGAYVGKDIAGTKSVALGAGSIVTEGFGDIEENLATGEWHGILHNYQSYDPNKAQGVNEIDPATGLMSTDKQFTRGKTTTGGTTGTIDKAYVGRIIYRNFAGATATGAVSVGYSGAEKRIQNVAAGEISPTSTDAINGSQLYIATFEVGQQVESSYFHTNEGTGKQEVGDTVSNKGKLAELAGARSNFTTTAGIETRATGEASTSMGYRSVSGISDAKYQEMVFLDAELAKLKIAKTRAEDDIKAAEKIDETYKSRMPKIEAALANFEQNMTNLDNLIAQTPDTSDAYASLVSQKAEVAKAKELLTTQKNKLQADKDKADAAKLAAKTALDNTITPEITAKSNQLNTFLADNAKKEAVAMGAKAQAIGEKSVSMGSETVAAGNNTIALGQGALAGIAKEKQEAIDTALAGLREPAKEYNDALNQLTELETKQREAEALPSTDVTREQKIQAAAAEVEAQKTVVEQKKAAHAAALETVKTAVAAATLKDNAIAIGNRAVASGEKSISVGFGNTVLADNAGAFGDPSTITADGTGSYSFGNNNYINTADTFVLGSGVGAEDATNFGTVANSVYLGKDSTVAAGTAVDTKNRTKANEEGTTTTAGATGTVENAKVAEITYGGFAGATAVGAVSVGSSGEERRIQNVAAGEISKTSTDAINGSQLYYVAKQAATPFTVTANSNKDTDAKNLDKQYAEADGKQVQLGETFSITGAGDAASNTVLTRNTDAATAGEYSAKNIQTVVDNAGVQIQFAEKPEFKEIKVKADATDNNPVTITSGAGNTGGTISNLDGNLNGAKTNTTAPTTVGTAPDNVANINNNAATVGDVLNSGWNLQGDSAAKDFVKAYDTVNFIDGNATDAVVTTAADGLSSTVTYNVKVDGTTIKVVDGKLTAEIPQIPQVPSVETTTLVDNKTGTGDTATDVADGKIDAPATGDENKFVKAGDIANAINTAAWKTIASGNTEGTPVEDKVSAGDKVEFVAGNNLKIKQDNETNNTKFTYSLNPVLTNLTSAEFKNGNNVTNITPTGTTTTDGTTTTTVAPNSITVGDKQGDTTDTPITISSTTTGGNTKNVIDGLSNNLPETKNAADNTTTKTQAAPTDTTAINNNAATVGDVLNAGWNLQAAGTAVDFVKPYDTVNIKGDGAIKVAGTNTDGANSTVTISVETTTLTDSKTAGDNNALTDGADGKIDTPDTANATKFVNAGDIANAINNSGFKLKSSATADGTNATEDNDLKTKGELINPADTVEMVAGKNMTVKQDQNGKITYATENDVEFNTVKVGETGTGTDTKKPVNLTTTKATEASNNSNTNKPTTALDIKSTDGKPTQITGVGSVLNTQDVATDKDGNKADGSPTENVKLVNLTETGVNPNAAATVGDLQNMGWVVSATGNEYKDTVKNANQVDFKGTNLAKVTGETVGDIRTITVDVNAQKTVEAADTPVIYTDAEGNKLVKGEDGKFYKPADLEGATYNAGDKKYTKGNTDVAPATTVIASMNDGDEIADSPKQLSNVQGNLTPTYNKGDATVTNGKLGDTKVDAPTTSQTAPTAENVKKIYNNAATVGDVLNAGWNLQGNGVAKDFVKPYDTVNFVNGTGTTVDVSTDADGKVSVVKVNTFVAPTNLNKEPLVKANDGKWYKAGDVTNGVKNENAQEQTPSYVNVVNPTDNSTSTPTKLGNVASSLNNQDVNIDPDGNKTGGTAASNTQLVDLKGSEQAPVNKNAAATVGDLQNMGWVVKADSNSYSDVVKNANEVEFRGVGVDVNGETDSDGKRVITIKAPINVAAELEAELTANPGATGTSEASGKIALKADNSASGYATAGNVKNMINTAGWQVQENGTRKDLVKAGDKVNFVNGAGTTVKVTTADGGESSDVKVNIDTVTLTNTDGKVNNPVENVETLTKAIEDAKKELADAKTEEAKAEANKKLADAEKAADTAGLNKVATAQNVAEAINKSGFKLITGVADGGTNATAEDTADSKLKSKGELINPADTVTMQAGKNMTVKHEKDGKITYATKDDVEFNTVKVGGDKDNNKSSVELKTVDGIQTTETKVDGSMVDTVAPTTLSVKDSNNENSQITGIASSMNTKEVETKPSGTAASDTLLDLTPPTNTAQKAQWESSAITAGDVAKMGWVVSATGNEYKDTVKNANQVDFKGTGLATVTGETKDGVRTITVNVDAQKTVEAADTPVVYTNKEGDKLTKVGDKFYKVGDIVDGKPKADAKEVAAGDVIASMNDGDNIANNPKQLSNVKGNLAPTYNEGDKEENADKRLGDTVVDTATTDMAAPTDVKSVYNNAATVGDVLNAGWNLQGNGEAVDFVKPYDTVNFQDGMGTLVSVVNQDGKNIIQVDVDSTDITIDETKGKVSGPVEAGGKTSEELVKAIEDAETALRDAEDELAAAQEALKADENNADKQQAVKDAEAKVTQAETNVQNAYDVADKAGLNKVATAQNVADAINKSGFTLKADKTDGENLTAEALKDGELINPGDVVTMQAGKNMTVKQEADGKITYATKDDVEFNTVTVGTPDYRDAQGNKLVKVGDQYYKEGDIDQTTGKPKEENGTPVAATPVDPVKTVDAVKLTSEKGLATKHTDKDGKVTDKAAPSALSVKDTGGNNSQISGVASALDTKSYETAPTGKDGEKGVSTLIDIPTVESVIEKLKAYEQTLPADLPEAEKAKMLEEKAGELVKATEELASKAVTVGDIAKMGWIVSATGNEYKDTVKNANEVKFTGKDGIKVVGETKDNVREITISLDKGEVVKSNEFVVTKEDGTTVEAVKVGDKYYAKADIDPTTGLPKSNTNEVVVGDKDKVENKGTGFVTGNQVADAIQKSGFIVGKQEDISDINFNNKDEKVNPNDNLRFADGESTVVNVGTVKTIDADGSVVTNTVVKVDVEQGLIKLVKEPDQVTGSPTGKVVGSDTVKEFVEKLAADNPTENYKDKTSAEIKEIAKEKLAEAKEAKKDAIDAAKDALATKESEYNALNDQLKAIEAELERLNNLPDAEKQAKAQEIADKEAEKEAKNTELTAKAAEVTTAKETLTTAEKPVRELENVVNSYNKLATTENVVEAINNSGFKLKADKTDGENLTAKALEDGELINPGDTVTMQAGKNMTVKQESDGKITYATKDDVEFNTVTVGPDYRDAQGNKLVKVGDKYYKEGDIDPTTGKPKTPEANGGNPVTAVEKDPSKSAEAVKLASEKGLATKHTDKGGNVTDKAAPSALSVKDTAGNNSQITGIASALDTKEVATKPTGKDSDGKDTLVDLSKVTPADTATPEEKTAAEKLASSALTVKDAANMGWVVSATGNDYTDTVKNANEVKFTGKDGIKVVGETKDNIREITISLDKGEVVKSNEFVVTKEDGTTVEAVKVGDEYYAKADIDPTTGEPKAGTTALTPKTNADGSKAIENKGANFVTGNAVADAIQKSGFTVGKQTDTAGVAFDNQDEKVNPDDNLKFADGKGTVVSTGTVKKLDTDGTVSTTTVVKVDVDSGKLTNNDDGSVNGMVSADEAKKLADDLARAEKALADLGDNAPETVKNAAKAAIFDAEKAIEKAGLHKVATVQNVADAINNSGFTLKTSANGGEKISGSDELINPADTIDMAAGKNLTVKQDANGKVTYATAENVNFTSVQFGDNGPVVSADGNNIKVGDTDGAPVKITNVAAGESPTDAVNVSQLKGAMGDINQRFGDLDKDLSAGIAGAMAGSNLYHATLPGKSMVSAGAATFRGQSALSVGYSRLSDNGKYAIKVQMNTNSRGESGAAASVGYQW